MLTRLFSRNPLKTPGDRRGDEAARALYDTIVIQARQPGFYTDMAIPDSVDGRFELLALHSFLVFHRLKQDRSATEDLSQRLFDIMAFHLDQSVRNSGAGDHGSATRLKAMGEALMGRYRAYEQALAAREPSDLEAALTRNLYGSGDQPSPLQIQGMAAYLRREKRDLSDQAIAELLVGRIVFGPPPSVEEASSETAVTEIG
ncbi:ubiquinol-cytochrome C chaperone family protein [Algihabitans albus]|uniref:ubiquinol-cytochrome C chaperone family protein n=1 Tax=Algihabitans albus TaxID=2164067 RepID=UPI000E5C6C4B|nr:ubiquinol-cytochrome C chaperone family protein [Algihabitans albus]